jgi:hypothetical protein
MATQPTSLREIRAEVRKLPRDRRREIVNAIRAGRAVSDPRDAPLAAAWADYLVRRSSRWPRWLMPRERPQGKHAWLWLIHVALLLIAVGITFRVTLAFPTPWRYLVIAWLAYSLVTTPLTMRRMLRSYWNARQAAAANRELVEHGSVAR